MIAEINEIEMKKTIEKINEGKSWFFELINKIDKPLARLKEKRRGFRSIKIKDKKEEITSATTEIWRIIRDCYKQLYANKVDYQEETQILRKVQSHRTEVRRSRKGE